MIGAVALAHVITLIGYGTPGNDASIGVSVFRGTAGPAEFGGPGDVWSPETMLVGSVANCFILSFRAIARASRFEWVSLSCDVAGTLDKVERVTQFTRFDLRAELTIAPGADEKKAHRLLFDSPPEPAYLSSTSRSSA
jgi:organic hydroperoxide reductase OsmC/OhrA